jgi:HSP20 family molecular chaperone IbpA
MEMNAVVSPSTALAMSFINLFGGNKGYDVNERQNSYDITMDVPGVVPSDIEVKITEGGRMLGISVKNYKLNGKVQAAAVSYDFKLDERCIHISRISCILVNGTLRISIPKRSAEELNKSWALPVLVTADLWRSNANLNNNNPTSTTNNSRSAAKPFQRPLPALEQHTLPSLEHPLPSLLDQDSEKEDETTAALSFENGQGSLLTVPSSEFDNTKLEDGAVQTGSQRKGVLKKQLFSTFSLASRSGVELLDKDRE